MHYRNFAIATLIAAPLLVMAVQSVMPGQQDASNIAPSSDAGSDTAAAASPLMPPSEQPGTPPPGPPPPSYAANNAPPPSASTTDMGKPLPGAGEPMMAPGNGLPQGAVPPMLNPVPDGSVSQREEAPPGR